jgi:hypothetical protein
VLSRALTCAVLFAACCSNPQILAFKVEPSLVCPGEGVHVRWEVRGRASLQATRGPKDWDEGEVPSDGERVVVPSTTTEFKLTALDANPARSMSYANQNVQVAQLSSERAVETTCDPATRKCTGTFTLETGGGALKVRELSAPMLVRSGHQLPAQVCVTHQGLARTCIQPQGNVTLHAVADGPWNIETDLGPGDPVAPPPRLQLSVAFECR